MKREQESRHGGAGSADQDDIALGGEEGAVVQAAHQCGVHPRNPGRRAMDMLTLDRPTLDWVALARGQGVPGERVVDAESLTAALGRGLATPGPYLVEAVF